MFVCTVFGMCYLLSICCVTSTCVVIDGCWHALAKMRTMSEAWNGKAIMTNSEYAILYIAYDYIWWLIYIKCLQFYSWNEQYTGLEALFFSFSTDYLWVIWCSKPCNSLWCTRNFRSANSSFGKNMLFWSMPFMAGYWYQVLAAYMSFAR